jgi:hypothetical protein
MCGFWMCRFLNTLLTFNIIIEECCFTAEIQRRRGGHGVFMGAKIYVFITRRTPSFSINTLKFINRPNLQPETFK